MTPSGLPLLKKNDNTSTDAAKDFVWRNVDEKLPCNNFTVTRAWYEACK